jgi:pimeloyl-ACP methyl ester carboxylesterase
VPSAARATGHHRCCAPFSPNSTDSTRLRGNSAGFATVPLPRIPITVVAAGSTGRPWRRPASGSLREQADLARLLGASVYRPVDDAAHLVPLDRPDAVAEEIRAVLRAVHHGS